MTTIQEAAPMQEELTPDERAELSRLHRKMGRLGGRPRVIDDQTAAEMMRLKDEGMPVKDIATRYGVHVRRVYEAIERARDG